MTEHHEIFWPLVFPLPTLLRAALLAPGDRFLGQQPGWRAGITRWRESQIDIRRELDLKVVERGLVEHVRLVSVTVNIPAPERRLASNRPESSGMVEVGIVQVGLPRGRMARHQETN
jgi:hypothetical protein